MKKLFLCMMVFILCVTLSIIVSANQSIKIQAVKVDYPIIVDGVPISSEIPVYATENRTYVHLRAMCEFFNYKIEWSEEKKEVEIVTAIDKVEVGRGKIDLDITKETAITITDAIFLQISGEKFINETAIRISDGNDGKYYAVTRFIDDIWIDGGDITIVVRKSDGKIMRIEYGE